MTTVTLATNSDDPLVLSQPQEPGFILGGSATASATGHTLHGGRWTLLGQQPAALITGRFHEGFWQMAQTTWRDPDGRRHQNPREKTWVQDPFAALRNLQNTYSARPPAGRHLPPFCGGLVGYFGYESALALDQQQHQVPHETGLPDLAFMVSDTITAHDSATGQTFFIATGRGPTESLATEDARILLKMLKSESLKCPPAPPILMAEQTTPSSILNGVTAQFTQAGYCAAVEQCRQAILSGRVFEVCLTQQLTMDQAGEPWPLFQTLQALNPAPFASFLRFPGCSLLSTSPECFLHLGSDRTVESRPIKGTAPRGTNPTEDDLLRNALANSAKDRAENVMIVDLVRNDLGRVCETGNVEVPALCVVESHPTVHQLVSTVTGKLAEKHDALDLVQACFPGGSMTGAPKIEAMKLISEIEPTARGIYSGALGYWDRRGNMDLAMVIRTLVCQGNRAWLGTGGAITADSDPQAEYAETLAKASVLLKAIRITRNAPEAS